MMTIGDYRQLSDATFNAGLKSGSEYEYVDQPNRLHFYVIDVVPDGRRPVVHGRDPVAGRLRPADARRRPRQRQDRQPAPGRLERLLVR